MSRHFIALASAAVIGILAAPSHTPVVAQAGVPELAFDTNADFLRTPGNIYVGEVGGVGRNSQGRIFVYTRTGHPYATIHSEGLDVRRSATALCTFPFGPGARTQSRIPSLRTLR